MKALCEGKSTTEFIIVYLERIRERLLDIGGFLIYKKESCKNCNNKFQITEYCGCIRVDDVVDDGFYESILA